MEKVTPELVEQLPPEAQHAAHRLSYSVRHTCDLTGGSSGAALLDVETGRLLALHFGGLAVAAAAINTATHIMHLRQFLAGKQVTMPEQPAM